MVKQTLEQILNAYVLNKYEFCHCLASQPIETLHACLTAAHLDRDSCAVPGMCACKASLLRSESGGGNESPRESWWWFICVCVWGGGGGGSTPNSYIEHFSGGLMQALLNLQQRPTHGQKRRRLLFHGHASRNQGDLWDSDPSQLILSPWSSQRELTVYFHLLVGESFNRHISSAIYNHRFISQQQRSRAMTSSKRDSKNDARSRHFGRECSVLGQGTPGATCWAPGSNIQSFRKVSLSLELADRSLGCGRFEA